MKSFRIKYLFAILLLSGLLASCVKDDEGFITDIDGQTEEVLHTADIFGVVSDRADEPIEGAVATFKGRTTVTDENGIYQFDAVEVGSQHNSVKIEKEGYFENARTFRTAASGTLYQRAILLEKSFVHSFEANSIGTVFDQGVRLSFPANSVVIESTGQVYEGEVQVAMIKLDPTLSRLEAFMPGDLTGVEDDNTLSTLQSFGMVHVEMQTPTGEKLQIGANQNVEMSYRVSDEFLGDAPATIAMWSFDYDLGVWVKEGQATLSGGVYTGAVSHFSCWNYDISAPSVIASGQVVTNQGSTGHFYVQLLNAANNGGRGWTDDEGKFSGRVEAGVVLTLQVYSYALCNDVIYEASVGPFDTDTDLGEITIELDPDEFIKVTGTAVTCDLEPITKGYVALSRFLFPLNDGVIDFVSAVCNTNSIDLRIVDIANLQQTYVRDLSSPDEHELGQIVVCGEEANYLIIDNLYDEAITLADSLALYSYPTSTDEVFGSIQAIGINGQVWTDVNIGFVIGSAFAMDEIEEKTYPLNYASFRGEDETYAIQPPSGTGRDGTITIESISLDTAGNKVAKGTYSADCDETTTGEQRIITGSFNLNIF